MKEWFTAAELASIFTDCNAALEARHGRALRRSERLPETERGARLMGDREGWEFRSRASVGGGREYPLSALPETARLEIARRAAAEAPAKTAPAPRPIRRPAKARSSAAPIELSEKRLAKMEAQAAVVRALQVWRRTSGLGVERALLTFCAQYSEGAVEVPAWVRDRIRRVSKNALRDWERAFLAHGLAGLAPNYGARGGTGLLDTDQTLQQFVLGLMAEAPHVRAKTVHEGLKARFKGRDDLPSLRSVQRFVARWKDENAQLFTKIANPDAWRSKYKAASGSRSEGVERLNQLWEMDSTPGDIELADGTRHALIGIIDVYSRRKLLLVARTSSAAAISAAFRRAILEWGVPEAVRIDNGADYISRHMQRAYDWLQVETHVCPPFTPEAKPHIERAFRTFSHGLLELKPGFIGHNVAERKAIEARKSFADRLMKRGETVRVMMTSGALQEFCDTWCEAVYANEPHSGLDDKTPFQMVAEWTGAIRRIENERALDVLLSPTDGEGWRVVSKKGIRIERATFDHPALGGLEGKSVRVLFDEADYGHVYVFAEDGGFICKAFCPERTGVSRAEVAAARKANQAAAMAEGRKVLKQMSREARSADVVNEILASKLERAATVSLMPRRSEVHDTPALRAAAEAAAFGGPPRAQERTADVTASVERLKAEMATPAPPEAQPATPKERYRKALAVQAAREVGRPVDAADLQWLERYQRSSEYLTQRDLHQEFGDLYVGRAVTA